MPDLSLERDCGGIVAGVDEVGRGPWAGPVVAAAVILPPDLPRELAGGLDDSKKLKAARREFLCAALKDCASIDIGIGAASVLEIEQHNILSATYIAMRRALDALRQTPQTALIDGNRLPPDLPCDGRTVIKGDSISLSIAAASIVAKVTRDRIMTDLSTRYPAYCWERNSGYGTRQHQDGLITAGVTCHHRRTYAPIARMLGARC
jgi:ribonuclease HII